MVSVRSVSVAPSSLTAADLPWIIVHREDRCTLCGHCTSACPKGAIKLAHMRQRVPKLDVFGKTRGNDYKSFTGIRQETDPAKLCIGCGLCSMVCPNEAITPVPGTNEKRTVFMDNRKGEPLKRGGRRNAPGPTLLDKIMFTRISMLTDPALDAGRHEFNVTTTLGRVLSPEDFLKRTLSGGWIPPTREIFPFIVGSMSFGALSPNMWLGLLQGVAYCNEVLGIPVVMCTGEGGCPPWVLRSPYLKYIIFRLG